MSKIVIYTDDVIIDDNVMQLYSFQVVGDDYSHAEQYGILADITKDELLRIYNLRAAASEYQNKLKELCDG
jgi:hypothetical protein